MDNIFTMETITWRQSLLIINRSNQIRSDARNCDGRHEQTYREAILFPWKKIPRDFYIFCDNDYLSNTKSVTVVIITQSYDHTRSVTSTLQLVNRTSRPPTKTTSFLIEFASRTVNFRQFYVINHCYRHYIITHFI